jgi:hypothetical protein
MLLDGCDDVLQVARDMALFEPCGEGNRQPRLLVKGEVAAARAVRGGHLQLELLTSSGQQIRAFGLGLGSRADSLPREVGVVGTLRVTSYRSIERAEMRIEQFSNGSDAEGLRSTDGTTESASDPLSPVSQSPNLQALR